LTSFWSAICRPGCDDIPIEKLEEFGLDKHPYFRDFFWDCMERHKCILSDDTGVKVLAEHECDDDSDICIQKKDRICEEEFYKHLLCVFSNVDDRDRFIITIALMEALYVTTRIESLGGNTPDPILSNPTAIGSLFKYMSRCFADRVRVANYLDNMRFGENGTDYSCGVNAEIDTVLMGQLLEELSDALIANCLFMEVVLRNVSKKLIIYAGTGCGTTGSPCATIGCINKVQDLLAKVKCGKDVRHDIICKLEKCELHIEDLFCIIGGDSFFQ